ncbi:MAG: aryl-sulfate sulfotransferase [Psychroserpens sp.]|nr:aryl-sulfate sulfotransferase [Psychroserpens sp.]MBO6630502.1 aryl-sulfate sulfotransferase [Psychroserpens sp.]MBO6652420.1 aryl-sulfate sulfotransferase [Psychroserpens sp.]MBO6681808.1 aryl-sulfate sulfotransferase [Psychroserpens sp.]MBO6749583.1 aryl-sulfate sulfotransferase [Psychroserpens sp.]
MIRQLLLSFCIFFISFSHSQNTVGTTFITEDVYDAFTLITANTKAYLINNCGEIINEWTSAYIPGNAVYLLPNGNLLRAGRVQDGSSDIVFGGQGGIVELFDWDGNLLWSFLYNSNQERQHHDIFPMPNGNILILAATSMSSGEAILAGRDPNNLPENRLYNEQIIEVEPIGTDQANIVWEWNVSDHLIQDFDNARNNFGDVSADPGKLDINFLNGGSGAANWLHFNSIQYDETLDQIVISSRNLSEIYIIDHSTTTAEAATSSGGTYGKGGDFLYRWGNPQSYRQGTETDRVLYGQHYPYYIPSGLNDERKIMLFNNGNGRTPSFSEVMIIDPPATTPGFYDYTADTAYGPATADYTYEDQSASPSPFYSSIVSSAQRLPNGNTLICEGQFGEVFEIDSNENKVWEYINPVHNINGSIATQGNPPPGANILFRAIKYAPDFPAFTGRDLTPGLPIEINPDLTICSSLSIAEFELDAIEIYPNPTSGIIQIESELAIDGVNVYSMLGQKVLSNTSTSVLDLSSLQSGVYILNIISGERQISKRIVKQ